MDMPKMQTWELQQIVEALSKLELVNTTEMQDILKAAKEELRIRED